MKIPGFFTYVDAVNLRHFNIQKNNIIMIMCLIHFQKTGARSKRVEGNRCALFVKFLNKRIFKYSKIAASSSTIAA